jgi:aryl-alcohol dehydrogenase-like predicted oxidoreductase
MTQENFTAVRKLGRSGLMAGRLGFGSSYGAPAAAYERAFERGQNYFYWGSARREGMGDAIRNLAPRHRDKMIVVLQSYSRSAAFMKWTYTRGLKRLKLDHADVLLLGWYNELPSQRVMDAALSLKERGLTRAIAISCHNRPMFETYAADPRFDIIMVRYNAAHRGAEREVFPKLPAPGSRPGVVSYTATRWGYLVNPEYTPKGMRTPTAADCYRFALSNPAVDVCLSGPASDEEMTEDLVAIDKGPMNEEELKWMRAVGDHVHKLTSRKWYSNPFMQRKQ